MQKIYTSLVFIPLNRRLYGRLEMLNFSSRVEKLITRMSEANG